MLTDPEPVLERARRFIPEIQITSPPWTPAQSGKLFFLNLRAGAWEWQLQILPAQIDEIDPHFYSRLAARFDEGMIRHSSFARIFLTQGPPQRELLAAMEHLCAVAWAFLGVGATAILFPTARAMQPRERLLSIVPTKLTWEDLPVFFSFGKGGNSLSGREWARTWGMAFFGLPDLVCSVSASPEERGEEVEGARMLFATMIPYLITEMKKALPMGDTIDVEHRCWQVVEPETFDPLPFHPGRNGVQIYRRYDEWIGRRKP